MYILLLWYHIKFGMLNLWNALVRHSCNLHWVRLLKFSMLVVYKDNNIVLSEYKTIKQWVKTVLKTFMNG